jgi:hypothetical protein
MRDWHQSRRDLLKRLGVGAACLPLLRAHRGWGAPAPRKRLVVIEMVHGYRQAFWKPAPGPLAGRTLPDTISAFDPVRDAMIFLPDLTNPGAGTNGRYLYGVMFYGMPGVPTGSSYKEPDGPTLDQVVAKGVPAQGGRASLHLGVQLDRVPRASVAPGANFCFWSGAGQPIHPQGDPVVVYADVMAGPGAPDPTAVRRLIARRKSILDYVGSNLDEFRARSGTEDRAVIDAHMESIRDLERQLAAAPQTALCAPTKPPAIDVAAAASYASILEAHLRLMVVALACGVTNVVTLQTSDVLGLAIDFGSFVPGIPAKSTSGFKTPWRNWADLAHNPVQGGVDHKKIVDRWFCERFAEALVQMRQLDEGGSTLLDNTVVVIGNNMQEGANHDAQKVPWMLAGGGSFLKTGNCPNSAGQSTASVMAGVCDALGVQHPYGAAFPDLKKI